MNKEKLFEAMSDVGDDLLVMAEQKRFTSTWRKWGQMAAVFAVIVCAGALAFPYLSSVGTKDTAAPEQAQLSVGQPESGTTAVVTTDIANQMGHSVAEAPIADLADPMEAAEETVADGAQAEEEVLKMDTAVQRRFVCRGTYYYLNPMKDIGVPPLGEELGQITEAEEADLVGCSVYTVPYSTWFENFAVNGQPVTQEVYIQTPTGYRFASTANEKIVSRYTIEDVQNAIEEKDEIWLVNNFVRPVENAGEVDFANVAELSAQELHAMLWAGTTMNTGVVMSAYWKNEEEHYVIPISEVRWRLDRFLDGYIYDPTQTGNYDADLDALVYDSDPLSYDTIPIEVQQAQIREENHLYLQISLPEKAIQKEYLIRFDEDSWRYEMIRQIMPE